MPGRRGIWPVFALVLLGHGAALTQLTAPGPPPLRGQAGLPVQLLYVRAMQPPTAETPPVTPAPSPALTAVAPAPEPAQPLTAPPPAPQPAEAQTPLPRIEAAAGRGAEPVAPEVVAAAPAPAASAPAVEAPYLPRGELTVTPKLLAPVDVPFPEELTGVVDLKVRVSLFIDEDGTVRRIRVDTPGVHPSIEKAVREAFSPARFSPGQLQATPVRSQIRLEVEFAAKGRPRTR